MRLILFILIVVVGFNNTLQAQVPEANLLVKIHEVTTTEMNSISNPLQGSFSFNTNLNKMFVFNGTEWTEMTTIESEAYPGHFIINSSGTQTISGLPFAPSYIIFSGHPNIQTTTINSDNGVGNNSNTTVNTFGTMSGYSRNDGGTINQQVTFVGGNASSINDISRYANTGECIGVRYANFNGDNLGLTTAILTGFTSDGFTINVNNHTDNLVVMFTAFK
ncbi:hypothetical protein [Aurantibacter sp.]|uniref:hypothetical protein n=1 Tax=Aurantibacter sp. TaxID=2807103 RepID=UPI003263E82D